MWPFNNKKKIKTIDDEMSRISLMVEAMFARLDKKMTQTQITILERELLSAEKIGKDVDIEEESLRYAKEKLVKQEEKVKSQKHN